MRSDLLKKCQIQMGESIAVLFIFFILVVFGFAFYSNIMKGSAKSQNDENAQMNAITIAQRVSFLPELQCSKDNVIIEGCLDLYKLNYIGTLLNESNVYFYDMFMTSTITVVQEMPPDPKVWVFYNHTPKGYKTRLSSFIPVSLYNDTTKKFNFGILVVDVYSGKV